MKTIEQIIDEHWEKIFEEICKLPDEDLYELKIEYQDRTTGKTITRSWLDREQRLSNI